MICALVQVVSGLKAVALVPVVMSFPTAHSTLSAYHALCFTSAKSPTVGSGAAPNRDS